MSTRLRLAIAGAALAAAGIAVCKPTPPRAEQPPLDPPDPPRLVVRRTPSQRDAERIAAAEAKRMRKALRCPR